MYNNFDTFSPDGSVIAITNRHLIPTNKTDSDRAGLLLKQTERIMKLPFLTQIILREKDMSPEDYYELAKNMSLCVEIENRHRIEKGLSPVYLTLHNYYAEAISLGCRRIHLPFSKFIELKDTINNFDVIGTSIHSIEDAELAIELGATYVTAGHIFATDCKPGLAPRGLDFMSAISNVCHDLDRPLKVYGIGGISTENAGSVLRAGADGVCMMSSFMRY